MALEISEERFTRGEFPGGHSGDTVASARGEENELGTAQMRATDCGFKP
jgi:hypothetical protein